MGPAVWGLTVAVDFGGDAAQEAAGFEGLEVEGEGHRGGLRVSGQRGFSGRHIGPQDEHRICGGRGWKMWGRSGASFTLGQGFEGCRAREAGRNGDEPELGVVAKVNIL